MNTLSSSPGAGLHRLGKPDVMPNAPDEAMIDMAPRALARAIAISTAGATIGALN